MRERGSPRAKGRHAEGDREQDLLIYCATGNRSTVAAKILIDNGFKRIVNMRQGIAAWQKENFPVAP